ncbi:MAG: thiol-disulfide isomerase/thioredoxin [Cellvibrionaceae bacterium]|jgi:thiol-disulfide isomerase/thioredoxin
MQNTSLLTRRALIKTRVITGATLASLAAPITLLAQSQSRVIRGEIAPELQAPYSIDGKGKERAAFSVTVNRKKWVYLKCFQHWCPGCHSIGFPGLKKLVSAFPNHDQLAVAAIQSTFKGFSTINLESLQKNQLRYDLDIPFGHDFGDSSAPYRASQRSPQDHALLPHSWNSMDSHHQPPRANSLSMTFMPIETN